MIFSFDLLINAIVSGILIGGFYAAVTSGVCSIASNFERTWLTQLPDGQTM